MHIVGIGWNRRYSTALVRLVSVGIGGTALRWFDSYIRERYQKVVIAGRHTSSSQPQLLRTGVAQGSVLGPALFSIYTRTLGSLLRSHGVSYHLYADDTQIYVECSPNQINEGIEKLQNCLSDVQKWMAQHRLMLNSSKTDFIVFASKDAAKQMPIQTLRMGETTVEASRKVKNIGFTMDCSLTSEDHINNICRSSFIQLKRLSKIKCFIDHKSLEIFIHSFITSRIDYCNSLLYGTKDFILSKLQRLQNSCARLLMNIPRFNHITPILIELHWLPVKQRIHFKICVITFKCIHGLCPQYLNELLSIHEPARNFRSNDALLLTVPFTRSPFLYSTCFYYYAPRLWNQLPFNVRSAQSLDVFKSKLKTVLFTDAFF